MRAMLIVNPHATSTTPGRRDLIAHALASEVRLSVEHTAGRDHAVELAAKAVEQGVELVVVHGGDGTVNEAVNGMMSRSGGASTPMLGIVPGGSTNVFARAVGIDPDPTAAAEQLLDALATRQAPRTVSLGRVDGRYFTVNAGLGLDADVVEAVEQVRATGRPISNSLHVRQAVRAVLAADRRHPRLTVRLDDGDEIPGLHLIFVSNLDPWTYLSARPVRTNPGTSAGSGLGVFALRTLRITTVLRLAGQLLRRPGGTADARPARGPHSPRLVRSDDVGLVTCRSRDPIGLQVDGDYLGPRTAVVFSSVAGALQVVGPSSPGGPTTPVDGGLDRTSW